MADLDQSKLYFGDGEQIWTQSDIDDLYQDLTDVAKRFDAEEAYFFFYLLILKNEGLFSGFSDLVNTYYTEEVSPEFKELETHIYEKVSARLLQRKGAFFEALLPFIDSMKYHDFIYFLRLFDVLRDEIFTSNFTYFFEKLIDFFQGFKSGFNDAGVQPKEISYLVRELAGSNGIVDIYNPFAGIASFITTFPSTKSYYGEEKNTRNWATGLFRTMAHGLFEPDTFLHEDSFSNHLPTGKKFDFVVSNPPFGLQDYPRDTARFNKIEATQMVISRGLSILKPGGEIFVTASKAFLYSSRYRQFRKEIVENGQLKMVIGFPGNILQGTSIPFVLLHLKNDSSLQQVLMVDADPFVDKKGRIKVIDYEKLAWAISKGEAPTRIEWVDSKVIQSSDYNLLPYRYLVANEENTRLIDFMEFYTGKPVQHKEVYKMVKHNNLKEQFPGAFLKIEELEQKEITKHHGQYSKLESSCLLVGISPAVNRPTYFKYEGTPICIPRYRIAAFKVDEDKADISYLIYELSSTRFMEQLDAFTVGGTFTRISIKDYLQLSIELLPKNEQLAKVEGVKEAYLESRKRELARETEALGYRNEYKKDLASLVHTIRQDLNNLASNLLVTKNFLAENEGKKIDLRALISVRREKTLDKHLNAGLSIVHAMDERLEKLKGKPSKSKKGRHKVTQLIERVQDESHKPHLFTFEKVSVDKEAFQDESGRYREPEIKVALDDFKIVMNNIIHNAEVHGFVEKRADYKIRVYVTFDSIEEHLVIQVANNGRPADPGFNLERLVIKGEKTSDSPGSGIGGSDIKGLMQRNKGKLEWVNDPNAEFPVTYILKFPLVEKRD